MQTQETAEPSAPFAQPPETEATPTSAFAPLTLTDPVAAPKLWPPALERLGLSMLNDPRDLPFFGLMISITLVLVPFAIALYIPGVFRWWLAVPYFAVFGLVYLDRFILMLHNTSHRKLFKTGFGALNHYIPRFLGPFFGETPDTYFTHHVGMHHVENNLDDDLSTTIHYQRDSFLHFLHYYFSFIATGVAQLSGYFWKRGRRSLFWRTLLGEVCAYLVYGGLCFVNWRATLVVFIIPLFFVRFMMMAGNWGQHAFVDRADPGNSYLNSITCINTRYNRRCFNDGYHIGHHVKPTRHWTEMPGDLLADRAAYIKTGALVFEGVDFFLVWALLMTKQYKALAKRLVPLTDTPRSEAEAIELLKSRVARFPPAAVA